MNKEYAKQLLPIIQAWVNGKIIQYRGIEEKDGWYDVHSENSIDMFNPTVKWRIKPEPREFWLVVFRDNSYLATKSLHETFTYKQAGLEIIHVIEKLEN